MVCHRCPKHLFLELRLLGLAPEIEVRNQSPLTGRIKSLRDEFHDASRGLGKNLRVSCLIGEGDPKKDRWVSAPVVVDRIAEVHNPWREGREGVEMLDEFRRLCDSSR